MAHIDENNVEFSALKQFLPAGKADSDGQKSIKLLKEQDKGRSFIASRVRVSVCCDRCAARCVIYSQHMIGSKDGPSKKQLNELVGTLENTGYISLQ